MGRENRRAPGRILRQAKLVALLLFCLVNPFAAWAYLATTWGRWKQDEAPIGDALKRKRLAVLPLLVPEASSSFPELWLEATLSCLGSHDSLDASAHPESATTLEAERDPIALGRNLDADFVLDARLSIMDDELRLFARLLRLADSTVLWAQHFEGTRGDFRSFCDDAVLGVFRSLTLE